MTFSGRPYAQLGIAELERLVQDAPRRRATNEAILAELTHRKTPRAQALEKRLAKMLVPADAAPVPPKPSAPARPTPSPATPAPAPLPERETITNDPHDILRAWTVLEVLSPATFGKSADLVGGDLRPAPVAAARTRFRALEDQVVATRTRVERLRLRHRHLPALDRAFEAVRTHGAERPGLIQRIFRLDRYRAWKSAHDPLSSTLAIARRQATDARLLPSALSRRLTRSPWLGFRAEARAAKIETLFAPLQVDWRRERDSRQATAIDEDFFDAAAEHIQPSAPWFTAEEHREPDALFEATLDLHRAFIDAAAQPLRHNLGAALQVLDGKGLGDPDKDALIPDLWSSLFLVVPTMSTTFASVGTMLGRMPPTSLGWLLVDEAGQASPQQAVGAIMRADRVIVVGDPIQVPPVVMLPDRLTNAICRTFGVDAGRFSAPAASVQTLADDATAWFAKFPARIGSRTVRVPLLVHRRCSEPMFGIANRVAYEI